MGFTVTNLSALTAYRYLLRHLDAISLNMERLSTGYRINRAADDIGGFAMTEEMTKRIKGLEQARRNAQDGVSLLQEADSGMAAIGERLQELRTLAVEASSEVYTSAQREVIQLEIDELVREIDRLASATEFNKIQILKGISGMDIHVGPGADETIRISISSVDVDALGIRNLAVTGTTNTNAENAISSLDAAISIKIWERSQVGAYETRLQGIVSYLEVSQENMESARSRIREVDFAKETMALTTNQILRDSALAMLAQANLDAKNILTLI
jgi:flagellin